MLEIAAIATTTWTYRNEILGVLKTFAPIAKRIPEVQSRLDGLEEKWRRYQGPHRNHDLLRTTTRAFAQVGELWIQSLPPKEMRRPQDDAWVAVLGDVLKRLLVASRDTGAVETHKALLETADAVMEAVPIFSTPSDQSVDETCRKLTESFGSTLHALTGFPPSEPPTFLEQARGWTKNGDSAGVQILLRFVESLKNPREEEAWRAYQLQAFAEISQEFGELRDYLSEMEDRLRAAILIEHRSSPRVRRLMADRFQELAERCQGREPLLEQLDAQIAERGQSGRVVLAHGPGGVGKSSVLARWAAHHKESGDTVIAYCFQRDEPETVQTERCLIELVEALRYTAIWPIGKGRSQRAFEGILDVVQNHWTGIGRLVILIDGLDEAQSELPFLIENGLGAGVTLVLSARDEGDGMMHPWLENWRKLTEERFRQLDPDAAARAKRISIVQVARLDESTIEAWTQRAFETLSEAVGQPEPAVEPEDMAKVVKYIAQISNGLPLLVRLLLPDARTGRSAALTMFKALLEDARSADPDARGIGAYARQEIARLRRHGSTRFDDDAERLFGALAFSRSALTNVELARLSGVARNPRSLGASVQRLLSFSQPENGVETVSIFHPSLGSGFERELSGAIEMINERIAVHARSWAQRTEPYFLRHLPRHLVEAGAPELALDLLRNLDFQHARLQQLGEEIGVITGEDAQRLAGYARGRDIVFVGALALFAERFTTLRTALPARPAETPDWAARMLSELVGEAPDEDGPRLVTPFDFLIDAPGRRIPEFERPGLRLLRIDDAIWLAEERLEGGGFRSAIWGWSSRRARDGGPNVVKLAEFDLGGRVESTLALDEGRIAMNIRETDQDRCVCIISLGRGEKRVERLKKAQTAGMTLLRDGRLATFGPQRGADGEEYQRFSIWRWDDGGPPTASRPRTLDTESTIAGLAQFDDGRIVTCDAGGHFSLWSEDGQQIEENFLAVDGVPTLLRSAGTGRLIASLEDGRIFLIASDGGRSQVGGDMPSSGAHGCTPLGDRRLCLWSHDWYGLVIVDVEVGTARRISPGLACAGAPLAVGADRLLAADQENGALLRMVVGSGGARIETARIAKSHVSNSYVAILARRGARTLVAANGSVRLIDANASLIENPHGARRGAGDLQPGGSGWIDVAIGRRALLVFDADGRPAHATPVGGEIRHVERVDSEYAFVRLEDERLACIALNGETPVTYDDIPPASYIGPTTGAVRILDGDLMEWRPGPGTRVRHIAAWTGAQGGHKWAIGRHSGQLRLAIVADARLAIYELVP